METGLREGEGVIVVTVQGEEEDRRYSEKQACGACGTAVPELSPQLFSFNSPLGMCGACGGLGNKMEVDPDSIIPDDTLSINEGAIAPWGDRRNKEEGWTGSIIKALENELEVPLDVPWKKLTKAQQKLVLYGTGEQRLKVQWKGKNGGAGSWNMRFQGVINTLERRMKETQSEAARQNYAQYFRSAPCGTCGGSRLRPEAHAVTVAEKSIVEIVSMTVADACELFASLPLSGVKLQIAAELRKEIFDRLSFLRSVGLGYLTLDRVASSLSGGEAQRIRLASQMGSELSGVIYVLDEPSIGLHQRDNQRLIDTLCRLRDLGNSVLVVEHDEETIEAADHVVDFGPGAGRLGGEVVAQGAPAAIAKVKKVSQADTSAAGWRLKRRKSVGPRRAGSRLKVPPTTI